jgi:putative flippase GtrA
MKTLDAVPMSRALRVDPLPQAPLVPEFIRYFAASAAALAVDACLMTLLVQWAGWHYQWSAAAGFAAGTIVAYVLSLSWVFDERSFEGWHAGLIRFAAVGAAGLVLNASLMWAFTDGMGADYRWSKFFAAGLSFLFNYAGRRAWLFTRHMTPGGASA